MAHFLVYWKSFSEYGFDNAKDHVLTKGYGSQNLNRVNPGDIIWAVVKYNTDEWRLAQCIAVREIYTDESNSPPLPRAVADPEASAFFQIDDQPNFEKILRQLKFETGIPIIATGAAIGMALETVRRLAPDDAELLVNYSRTVVDDQFQYPVVASADEDPEGLRRRTLQLNQIVRNPNHVRWIKQLYKHTCQLCGETIQLPGGKFYSEVHHIQPLGADNPGPDERENLLCVCPNCHVRLDFGAIGLDRNKLTINRSHNVSDDYIGYHNTSKFRSGTMP